MKKENRIKKSEDIEKVLKNHHQAGNKNYIIYVKENSETKSFRLAMSVSKKIGNAVVRNRQKRLIKQAISELKNEIPPYDIFVVAKIGCLNLTYNEVKENIYKLLIKNKVLHVEE